MFTDMETSENLVHLIAQAIYDRKGHNIVAIDIRDVSSVTDFVVLAEGNVDRHVMAISREIEDSLAKVNEKPIRVEGRKNGDWIVLDYNTIIVHLFMPGLREKYQLERLWADGKIIDLNIEVSPSKA